MQSSDPTHSQAVQPHDAQPRSPMPLPDHMPHTLLVVEDEIPLREAIMSKFTREGFRMLEARNGEEGLKIALEQHPELILLDLIMPIMDGITMLGQLRKDFWGKTAKVIILTNLNDDEAIQEGLKRGTSDFLIKSDWKLKDLVGVVRKRLGIPE